MFPPDELLFLIPERSLTDLGEGGFARRIAVVVLDESPARDDRDFLTKILASAQIDLAKDTLLASVPPGEPIGLNSILKEKQAEQILVFGIPPAQLGLTIEVRPYQPIFFYGATWLFGDALSALEPDKTKKGLLWTALKSMFL